MSAVAAGAGVAVVTASLMRAPFPRRLTEQAGGPEHEQRDEHDERTTSLPLRAAEQVGAVVLDQPRTRPPSRAPRMLPMPPSTAAVNALMPSRKPPLYWTPTAPS